MKLSERVYGDVGAEYFHDQQICGKISPEELRHVVTRNQIRVDISIIRHLGYRGRICGSEEYYPGKVLPWLFFRKTKPLLPII